MTTAAEIRAALRTAYPAPQWALMFEVRNASGFDANRSADAVAMNTWPSQGLQLHGIEIKVSRSDWRNEIKDPAKAEAIARYCDKWFIAAPKGIVPAEELPDRWGLKEWTGERWVTVKDATQNADVLPITRSFLGALLRRASEIDQGEIRALVRQHTDKLEKGFAERVASEVRRRTIDAEVLSERVKAFEEASGVQLDTYAGGDIGAAVKIVRTLKLADNYSGVFWLLRRLQEISGAGLQTLADMGIEEPKQIDMFAPKPRRGGR